MIRVSSCKKVMAFHYRFEFRRAAIDRLRTDCNELIVLLSRDFSGPSFQQTFGGNFGKWALLQHILGLSRRALNRASLTHFEPEATILRIRDAVGTRISLRAPRTEPYRRLSRIRL